MKSTTGVWRRKKICFFILPVARTTTYENVKMHYKENGFIFIIELKCVHPSICWTCRSYFIFGFVLPSYRKSKRKSLLINGLPKGNACLWRSFVKEIDWKYNLKFWTDVPSHRKPRNKTLLYACILCLPCFEKLSPKLCRVLITMPYRFKVKSVRYKEQK